MMDILHSILQSQSCSYYALNCIFFSQSIYPPKTIQSIQAFWTKAKKANNPQGSTQNSLSFQQQNNWRGPARKEANTDNGHHGALIFLCWKRVAVVRSWCSCSFGKISGWWTMEQLGEKTISSGRPEHLQFEACSNRQQLILKHNWFELQGVQL